MRDLEVERRQQAVQQCLETLAGEAEAYGACDVERALRQIGRR